MTSPESPEEHPARSLRYAVDASKHDHRWNDSFVTMIITAVVAIVAAMTAVLVFGSGERTPTTPPELPSGKSLPTSGPLPKGAAGRSAGLWQAPLPAAPAAEAAVAGIDITLAPDWYVSERSENMLIAMDKNDKAIYVVQIDQLDEGETNFDDPDLVTRMLSSLAKNVSKNITGFESRAYDAVGLDSDRFQVAQNAIYAGEIQSQGGGTGPVVGQLEVFLNTSSGQFALVNFATGSEKTFNQYIDDVVLMSAALAFG